MGVQQEESENDLLDSILEYVGTEMAQELGKLGGQATVKKHGKEHYRRLAEHMNKVRKDRKESNG